MLFDIKVSMLKIDEVLSIGKWNETCFLVDSIFSGDHYYDVMDAEEILINYGVNVKEISYFNH